MKPLKLLLSISFIAISSISVAQTFFIDSSTYYSFSNAISVSGSYAFAYYSKEIIIHDSTNSSGEYYSVNYSAFQPLLQKVSHVHYQK